MERETPGAGPLSSTDLQAASQKILWCTRQFVPQIQWMESFVITDKIYCVYQSTGMDLIKQHAEQTGSPANCIEEIKTVINPETAE